jgi:DNA processing protein
VPALDSIALGLAAGSHPARVARAPKDAAGLWPDLPLADSLEAAGLHGPGAVAHWRAEAGRMVDRCRALGYGCLWPTHADYPTALGSLVDPPLLLWTRGDASTLHGSVVAVVGSRHATASGREVAGRLAADLAAAGAIVASGFAQGIDAAAHRGALTTGRSAAVLGCGLDQPYPRDHGPLGDQMARCGVLVSEFPPGTPPLAHHFPLRNRVLAGLAAGVVVVQAAMRSGSLITARLALEQGREVMAVPGDVRTGAHAGAHALIRDGARLVETAADVLDQLGWQVLRVPAASASGATDGSEAPRDEASLPAVLAREAGATLDDLMAHTGRNSADLLGELLDLELAGLVVRDAAGRFLPPERKW